MLIDEPKETRQHTKVSKAKFNAKGLLLLTVQMILICTRDKNKMNKGIKFLKAARRRTFKLYVILMSSL